MENIVIYYTRTNKTKMVAEIIAQQEDAKLLEIEDKKDRKGAIGYMKGAFDAMRSESTPIKYDIEDLKKYNTVFIGSPVWASKPTPAIRQYIEETNFEGVNVITFVTMMKSGEKKALKIMNDMIKQKGGNVIRSFAIITKNTDIDDLTKKALKKV